MIACLRLPPPCTSRLEKHILFSGSAQVLHVYLVASNKHLTLLKNLMPYLIENTTSLSRYRSKPTLRHTRHVDCPRFTGSPPDLQCDRHSMWLETLATTFLFDVRMRGQRISSV